MQWYSLWNTQSFSSCLTCQRSEYCSFSDFHNFSSCFVVSFLFFFFSLFLVYAHQIFDHFVSTFLGEVCIYSTRFWIIWFYYSLKLWPLTLLFSSYHFYLLIHKIRYLCDYFFLEFWVIFKSCFKYPLCQWALDHMVLPSAIRMTEGKGHRFKTQWSACVTYK